MEQCQPCNPSLYAHSWRIQREKRKGGSETIEISEKPQRPPQEQDDASEVFGWLGVEDHHKTGADAG